MYVRRDTNRPQDMRPSLWSQTIVDNGISLKIFSLGGDEPYQAPCTQPVVTSNVVLLKDSSEEAQSDDENTYDRDGNTDCNGFVSVNELVVGDRLDIFGSHVIRSYKEDPQSTPGTDWSTKARLLNQREMPEAGENGFKGDCL